MSAADMTRTIASTMHRNTTSILIAATIASTVVAAASRGYADRATAALEEAESGRRGWRAAAYDLQVQLARAEDEADAQRARADMLDEARRESINNAAAIDLAAMQAADKAGPGRSCVLTPFGRDPVFSVCVERFKGRP